MNPIKFEDLKVGESKNPIEVLLQQTGWSLEEALLRLSDYKSSTSANKSKNPDVKVEVKEELSDCYKFFMSVNKQEDESDSDVEIIEKYNANKQENESDSDVEIIEKYNVNDEKDDTIVTKSEPPIEIVDDLEEDLTSKSTVIDTISVSDKSENECDTDNFKQVYNTKVRNKLKVKKLSLKHKKQCILKKYKRLRKLIRKRKIEKAEKKAAEVRKRLKLQLELLREKKKPNLKFLCSPPEINAQNILENPSVEHDKTVVHEKVLSEECMDVLETGDSDLMIIDVVGGYESPDREETNYDLEDYSNDKSEKEIELSLDLSENAFFLDKDRLSEDSSCNSSNLSKATSKLKICDYIKKLMDDETEVPQNSNEKISASNENQSLEDIDSDQSNHSKGTSNLQICDNITQYRSKFDDEMKVAQNSNEKVTASNENQLFEDDDFDKSNQSKTTSKLKICENIMQSLEYEKRGNVGVNLEPMQWDKTKSTGNFLRSLSENIFSKPIVNAIRPTKTKDITKIKGWKNKRFVESNERKSAVSRDNSFLKLPTDNVIPNKSAFVSEQLDRLLSNAPQSYHDASSEIEESESTSNFVISSRDNLSEPSTSTIFTSSNIIDTSTNYTSTTTATASTAFPISTVFTEPVSVLDYNIAPSPALTAAVIATTSIMSNATHSENSTNSSTSTVSTIPTFALISTPTTVSTNTDAPSTSSTLDTPLKPYKPKTLAEKRRLLEASRSPLSAEVMYYMSRKQRQENQGRILNYRRQLVSNEMPFDRKSYTISSDITNTYSYIVCNGKRLKVASSKTDEVVAYIKNRKKMSKLNYYSQQPRSKTCKSVTVKKPSLLKSLKDQTEVMEWDASEWETVNMKLPKVFLSVVPQYGQVIHPKLEHLIRNETWHLSENRVKFALSLLRTKNVRSKLHTFKFPISYENNQETMQLKRKLPVIENIESKIIESDDEIQEGVKLVMDKLLNYVDVLDETKDLHMNYENVESSIAEPMLTVSKVTRPVKRHSGPRSKINKTALEMKRLNCQIVSVMNDEDNTDNEMCPKEVCKLGCVCKTLRCDSKNLLPIHCGSWKCIFKCSCKNNSNMDKTSLAGDYNLLNAGVINRLQDQAKKNLAKVEKEFTQTIIKTNNQLIMVGDSRERRRRVTKTPKKYNDFFNEDLTDTVDSDFRHWSTDDEVLPTLSDDIKPCSVPLTKYNLSDIIPYCMIHSMYKCVCMSTSDCGITDLQLVSPVPSDISHCSKATSPQKPELTKADAEKKQKRYKAAPRLSDFLKPRLKYVRKQRDDKTFNKEEFCSRTRGLSSPYYIPRNTTESYLDKTLRSSKRFCRDLYRYVRSLRVKLIELRRSYVITDPVQIKKEDMERKLLLQTIDRLSPYLQGEIHLDSLISRLNQRMNGIITPESRRRMASESLSVSNTDISEDTPEDIFPSNNLNVVANCYGDSEKGCPDQALLTPQSKIQEKYMSSSRQKEFRLLPWTSLQNNYNKKALEIWYLNTNKISPIIITQKNRRPSVNHCNIRIFEHLKDETSIPLDLIRCIIHRQVPMNKNPDNIFVILAFNEKNFSELYSVCEKSSQKNNLNDKIRVSLLQQIKETSISKDIDIESIPKEIVEYVTEELDEEILQGDFYCFDMQNKKIMINYFVRQFVPNTFYYDCGTPAFFDSRRSVRLALPQEVIKCKWRLIYIDQEFSYLRLSLNNFSIKYSDIVKVVQLAQKNRKTVFLASDSIRKGYSLKMFGIFSVPTYLDKIFVGPYLLTDNHHIDILNVNVVNETIIDVTNGIWVNQINGNNQKNGKNNDSANITETCIDLTEEGDLMSILLNWNCSNLLKILGFSSSGGQNEDIESTTDYVEDTYWNDLNILMKGIDFGKSNKTDDEMIGKHYYSVKNKCTIRYFVTNIPGLGYIKAFLHEVTNFVDIVCPITNQIRRFPNYSSAVNGITKTIIQNIIQIPFKIGLKVKMLAKLNPTMKTILSSTFLDGYHIAGRCGVKNIRYSTREDLIKLGLTQYEVRLVIEQRSKRQIYDLTDQLAQSFSLESISNKRSYGDVLTEVTKKIISTIKLSTAGSSIKNIENSFELINLYPTPVKTKIYKQLEYIARNLNKKELSTAELQKIRMSPQKKKSTNSISPVRSSSNTVPEMIGFQKIRLFPQTESSISVENDMERSTSNVASGELGNSQFQRIKLSNNVNLANCSDDIELKAITCKDMKFKDIRRSFPNEKFVISKSQKKANLSPNDVIITKLNRLHCFGTTVVSNKEKKFNTIEDDVIIIEPEPTPVQKVKPTSLLRNQKQPEPKKRSSQLEDNVVIQPEPKRLKTNIKNDITIQPELKNHITQLGNGTTQTTSKNTVLQNNIVVAPTKSNLQQRLEVLLAKGNTTSLLKGKYINLMPLKRDGENKYFILPNKDDGSPLRQNIDRKKFKKVSGKHNGNQVLVTSQNGKSLLVPQSNVAKTSACRKPVKILPKDESFIKFSLHQSNTILVPKKTQLSKIIQTNKKQTKNVSDLKQIVIGDDESTSSFITIQNGETTQCFKVLNKNVDE